MLGDPLQKSTDMYFMQGIHVFTYKFNKILIILSDCGSLVTFSLNEVSYNEKCTNKQLPPAEQISTDMRTARDTPLKTFRTDTVVNESKEDWKRFLS